MKRAGLTASEAVVVLGITALLIGLLVPAVQHAQQDARQQRCKNNLKQLGLALHNYHDVYLRLPPGWVSRQGLPGTGAAFGWQTGILPFIDQAVLFNQVNYNAGPLTERNRKLIVTPLANYRCPADRTSATNPFRGSLATSNYSGNYGSIPFPRLAPLGIADAWPGGGIEAPLPAARASDGMFSRNSSIGFRDVTDGTSNTVVAAERSFTSGAGIWMGVTDSIHEDDTLTDGSHLSRPNAGPSSYSSQHPGGFNALIGDGSVRFIKNSVDSSPAVAPGQLGLWQRLCSRNDGQPLNEF